ncbi:MAG: hypothetical protein JJU34_18610 [Lunatimonas sp.]|uniref:hypothetical protein n=1 Tax=Lunatimonas sp. TaxID=2060141 RepID=UPI00263B0B34|nr:hypothetical protein [Lunatimonas sp.]MCC5939298.1 hypothetical protein [Lunatimonas sp.]
MINRQLVFILLLLLGALFGISLAHVSYNGFDWERDRLLVISVTATALAILVGGASALAIRRGNGYE